MVAPVAGGIRINLERKIDESYDIIFGKGLFHPLATYLTESKLGSQYALITDTNILPLHGHDLARVLHSHGLRVDTFALPAGEQNKRIEECLKIMEAMAHKGYGRDSAVVALGGGMVGDMAGFVAAIYNRGIPFVQVPTTVLAQADAAVGGKTGVDTDYGKNLLGAFKQPTRVFVDVTTLQTLSAPEYRNGLAETIKHGIIADRGFFEFLETNMDPIKGRSLDSALAIAELNCRIKGKVVEQDPHERGLRRVLNYGHTFGHALEQHTGYTLPHGQCVAIGMMVAGRIAHQLKLFPAEDLARQETLLKKAGLPTTIPAQYRGAQAELIAATVRDKKAKNGVARYCLPKRIGEMHSFGGSYVTPVEQGYVEEAVAATFATE